MPEAFSFESRRHGGLFRHGVVAFLGFSGRDIADGLEKPAVIEPVDPFEGGELDRLPGAAEFDQAEKAGFLNLHKSSFSVEDDHVVFAVTFTVTAVEAGLVPPSFVAVAVIG